jgi:hypothetical protein
MVKISVTQPQTEAGLASAENGMVILGGPGTVAVTMSAEAAAQTGRNLISAAELAALQETDRSDQ